MSGDGVRPARQAFSPLDERLGVGPERLMPRLLEGVVRLGGSISFAHASEMFEFFTLRSVSAEPGRLIPRVMTPTPKRETGIGNAELK